MPATTSHAGIHLVLYSPASLFTQWASSALGSYIAMCHGIAHGVPYGGGAVAAVHAAGSSIHSRACQAALDVVQARLLALPAPVLQLTTARSVQSSPSTSSTGTCSPPPEPLHAQPSSSPSASQVLLQLHSE